MQRLKKDRKRKADNVLKEKVVEKRIRCGECDHIYITIARTCEIECPICGSGLHKMLEIIGELII